MLENYRSILL